MVYPADLLLIGAANPCRCGEYLEPNAICRCTPEKVREHLGRISGPLLDRMDLTAEMTRLSAQELAESVLPADDAGRKSADVRQKVEACWQRQAERCLQAGVAFCANGRYRGARLLKDLDISETAARYAAQAAHTLNISVRGYHKLLRVARTIADLDDCAKVNEAHVGEAMQYRHRPAGS